MSSRNKMSRRRPGRTEPPVDSRRQVPSPVAWRWPVILLACAGAGLTILIIRHYSVDRRPPVATVGKEERRETPLATGAIQPMVSSVVTNKPEPESSEDRLVALVSEGNQLLERRQYAEAANKFEQALSLSPDDEQLHYNLAIALARSGKTEAAKKHYTEALQIFPDYAEAHNNLGNLLMNENKLAEAIEHFREAIRIMPEDASFHNNLGTAFARQGKGAEAIAAFAGAITLRPAYVEARVNLGNACLAAGQVEEAVTQLSEALRLQPDFPPAIQAMQRARQRQLSSGAPKP